MEPRTTLSLNSRILPFFLIVALFLVYALLPTQNSTSDAYDYAASVKWQVDLWRPHHLFYNITGLGFHNFCQALGWRAQPLEVLKLMNSLAAGGCLLVLWRILAQLQSTANIQTGLLLVAGASFGTMRYATENETYLLPIFFSLLGSYFMLRQQRQGKWMDVVWSSFWAAFACLYHQVHFFWWLGLGLGFLVSGQKRGKLTMAFLLPAVLVPLAYALVMHLQEYPFSQFQRFVFQDFYKNSVETTVSAQNFLLTFISFIRTFFEVHGRMYFLLKQHLVYIIPAIVTFIIALALISKMFLYRTKPVLLQKLFFQVHLIILGLHMLFAWYAVGNAEFMVIVPFLVAILAGCFRWKNHASFWLVGAALFLWNMAYAVVPNHLYTYTNQACVYQVVQQKPGALLLLQDKNAFEAYHFYQSGKYYPNAYESWASTEVLTSAFTQAQLRRQLIYTDYSPADSVLNRAWFMRHRPPSSFFQQFRLEPVTSCPTLFGDKGLKQIFEKP
ncbi:hypothetical protein [Rufibacter hautae]|uniref:Glycosyltransferase RgtA/B/C/D-like domain-containing protein n=1 Tax=Rufibacter hautae TaxID=2595005 RepID=A0A5B6TDY2_9BACT|nr:hypothetical protein [Rufibacter hautae]KAA3438366.1 hypothetical protein FOA19_14060 [Rufibacter hautae]